MFSQTIEYAFRAMMHLASRGATPQTSDRIAASVRVPPGYLCKVLRDLVRAGLVESFRGPGGGFVLAARAEQITLYDVIAAVDPIKRIRVCPMGNPEHANLCPLHRRLDDALADIESSFRRTTLAEMLASGGIPGGRSLCDASAPRSRAGRDTRAAG